MDVVIEATPFPMAGLSLPKADPCVIVIFGALGDLAKRKLVPALFRLAGADCLSSRLKVLGVAREQINDEEYRERMRAGAAGSKEAGEVSDAEWRAFAGCLHYQQGDLDEVETYRRIARRLEQMTLQEGASENRLFYLSTPPSIAPVIVHGIGILTFSRRQTLRVMARDSYAERCRSFLVGVTFRASDPVAFSHFSRHCPAFLIFIAAFMSRS